jgi:hypothetical protein
MIQIHDLKLVPQVQTDNRYDAQGSKIFTILKLGKMKVRIESSQLFALGPRATNLA